MYPSMKKIPGDLPCHERYTALSRSRSTRALKSQKVWPVSWTTGDDSFAMRDDNVEDIISLRSSGSSVYSQKTISEESVSSWEYASPR
jgi:hypothetical protein